MTVIKLDWNSRKQKLPYLILKETPVKKYSEVKNNRITLMQRYSSRNNGLICLGEKFNLLTQYG